MLTIIILAVMWLIAGVIGMYIGHAHVKGGYCDTSVGEVIVGAILGYITFILALLALIRPYLSKPFFKAKP
jgi:multisubunit Na+/H+ antiporter MnhG subunit